MTINKSLIIFGLGLLVGLCICGALALALFVARPAETPSAVPPTAAPPEAADGPAMPAGLSSAEVVRVIDGDTADVQLANGETLRLRLIGLDTPETVAPNRPVECFGREASDRAKQLLTGQTVFLEADRSQNEEDRYGRLLRYVWLADGRLFNYAMIAEGYAFEYTYQVPYAYQAQFRQAERTARDEGRGLWADDACAGQQIPADQEPVLATPSPAAPPQAGNCDPAYPDVCIPSPPPDLSCRDVPDRRFRVLPPDPHNFDGNDDGVGCEV